MAVHRKKRASFRGGPRMGPMRLVEGIVLIFAFVLAAGFVGRLAADHVGLPVMSMLGVIDPPKTQQGNTGSAKITLNGFSVCFLQTGAFKSEENAAKAADQATAMGGAGYRLKDGEQERVILSAYLDEASAKTVQQRLLEENDLDTSIYKMEMPTGEVEAAESQREAVQKALDDLDAAILCFSKALLTEENDQREQHLTDAEACLDDAERAIADAPSVEEDSVLSKLYAITQGAQTDLEKAKRESGKQRASALHRCFVKLCHERCTLYNLSS